MNIAPMWNSGMTSRTRSSLPVRISTFIVSAARRVSRWPRMQPFGRPVVPLVYTSSAMSSGRARYGGSSDGAAAMKSSYPTTSPALAAPIPTTSSTLGKRARWAAISGRYSASAISTRGLASATIEAISGPVSRKLTVAMMMPLSCPAASTSPNSMLLRPSTDTRSCLRTPAAASADASRAARASSCA